MNPNDFLSYVAIGVFIFSVVILLLKRNVASRLWKAREEAARENPLPAGPDPEPSGNP
jgi:hypothetical protein